MPKRLLARCRPDSIDEFRQAAETRFNDGLQLAANGRRLAAIYLWGYSAEMAVKAAYFSFLGLGHQTPITWNGHLLPAMNLGQGLGIAWSKTGRGHDVRAWAELFVKQAAQSPPHVLDAQIGLDIQRHAERIGRLWNETLRCHKNVPYAHELSQVRTAAEWLLASMISF